MNIDSYRRAENEAKSFCHSELEVPQLSVDVAPSISTGAGVTRKLAHVDSILTQLDLALAVIFRLLEKLPVDEITLDSFRTENGGRAEIIRDGSAYQVRKKVRQS